MAFHAASRSHRVEQIRSLLPEALAIWDELPHDGLGAQQNRNSELP